MPRLAKPLTDTAIRNAKPSEKPRRLFDGKGLYLLINPDGAKYWRLKYILEGKERRMSLGLYPETSWPTSAISQSKERRKLKDDIDPVTARKADNQARRVKALYRAG